MQLIVGFFAMAGLAGVDWGRRAARVETSCWVACRHCLGGSLTAIMSLVDRRVTVSTGEQREFATTSPITPGAA